MGLSNNATNIADTQAKVEKYNDLVSSIQKCERCKNYVDSKKLTGCNCCNEVNLWTYWVGGRDNLNYVRILLVGQDWGPLGSTEYESAIAHINGISDSYYRKGDSVTNDRLCRLFGSIGYNISGDGSQSRRPINELFFTNLIACYRCAGEKGSGGFMSQWRNNCQTYFSRLVSIINPRIILCLGKDVYRAVINLADQKMHGKLSYNDIITSGWEKIKIGDRDIMIFPLAHPGWQGTLNRCKDGSKVINKVRGEELQKKDWRRIETVLDMPEETTL